MKRPVTLEITITPDGKALGHRITGIRITEESGGKRPTKRLPDSIKSEKPGSVTGAQGFKEEGLK